MLLHELAEATAELAQREPMMEEEDDGDTLGSLGGSPSSQPRARWPFYWTRRLWESGDQKQRRNAITAVLNLSSWKYHPPENQPRSAAVDRLARQCNRGLNENRLACPLAPPPSRRT